MEQKALSCTLLLCVSYSFGDDNGKKLVGHIFLFFLSDLVFTSLVLSNEVVKARWTFCKGAK